MAPRSSPWFVLVLFVASLPGAAGQPATVYEDPDIPPQAMDFDADNNRFRAHPGWIDDKLIHYYKFRMYVPPNYGTDQGGLDKVPIAPLYLPSTDGTFAGVPEGQRPILKYHTADGTAYSDFVHIHFVTVPTGYAANSDKTAEAITTRGTVAASNIVANVPVVPTGSTLEDPTALGTDLDEVLPWMAWYEGDEVQTFVFESTSRAFADYINPLTRTGAAAAAGSGWESTVSAFATTGAVKAIPIWHVNQYQAGVTPGVNNGGPSGMGQRNVIDADRLDTFYSPLWQVYWMTQVPVGYSADQASSADQFTEDNGFIIAETPMYVNCPNLGPHGGTTQNTEKVDSFDAAPEAGAATIQGSIPMAEGVDLVIEVDGEEVGTTTTGMMGLFTYRLKASDAGEEVVVKRADDDTAVATYTFEAEERAPLPSVVALLAVLAAALLVRRRTAG